MGNAHCPAATLHTFATVPSLTQTEFVGVPYADVTL
jgi:hypothetical protein